MQNFQRLLKTEENEENGKGWIEVHQGGKKDAERGPTMFDKRIEKNPAQCYQVTEPRILTLNLTLEHGLILGCVFAVPQLSDPAAKPASGLLEECHLSESHFSQ